MIEIIHKIHPEINEAKISLTELLNKLIPLMANPEKDTRIAKRLFNQQINCSDTEHIYVLTLKLGPPAGKKEAGYTLGLGRITRKTVQVITKTATLTIMIYGPDYWQDRNAPLTSAPDVLRTEFQINRGDFIINDFIDSRSGGTTLKKFPKAIDELKALQTIYAELAICLKEIEKTIRESDE